MASNDSESSTGPERRPAIGLTTYLEQAQSGVWDVPAAFLPKVYFEAVSSAGGGVFTPNPAVTVPGTTTATLLGDRVTVQSYHHQALDQVAEGLTVSARSDDGVIQAVDVDAAIDYRDHRKARA